MTAFEDAGSRLAAIDPTRTCIVQSPAGSGKTELLIQRFLALLGKVRDPGEILAITFTRKAAGEMRTRLLQALETSPDTVPATPHQALTRDLALAALTRDRELGWGLKDNPSLLSIQTIDSFNATLVRKMPWVSRFGGMPEVAEDSIPLYREAARRALSRIEGNCRGGAEAALVLAHLDNRLDFLQEMLVAMLQRRDQWLRCLIGRKGVEQRLLLEKSLRSVIEEHLSRILEAFPGELKAEISKLARFAGANLARDGREGLLPRLAVLEAFPSCRAEDLPLWQGVAELLLTTEGHVRRRVNRNNGFPPGKAGPEADRKRRMEDILQDLSGREELARLLGLVRCLPSPAYPDEQWQVLEALVELLELAVAELWLVFREEGQVDFAEVALKALLSLRESGAPSELLLRLDARINHILVDEFQDTSHLQFSLLEQLTEGWQAGDGRTLFLVGDPMQSIYRFREAEVGLFLNARRKGIGNVPLEPLLLTSNFRSQAGIVDWVNEAFRQAFPSREESGRGAVAYSEARAVRARTDGPAVTVHPKDSRDDTAEAKEVVDLVQEALSESGDETVALLVRSRTHLSEILPALRRARLRYQSQDIDLLAERPVARDLAALTRALLHPGDRLSWLTVLRAPWSGLRLDDLHALCGGRTQASIPELLGDPAQLDLLSEDGRTRAGRVRAIMERGRKQRGRLGLRRVVEGCWLALGGPACVDAAAVEDAARVFDLLESLSRGGDLPVLERLEEGLARLFASPDTGADGRLQVMTIHKAKGLEFDTVILPGLGRKPARSKPPLLRWLEDPGAGLLLAPISPRDGGNGDPIYEALGRLEREKEDLETTRLLYVAATRARSRLHLLGHAEPGKDGQPRPAGGSLLEKLWDSVAEFFQEAPEPEPKKVSREEAAPPRVLLMRLFSGWSPPELPVLKMPTGSVPASPSRLGDESEPGTGFDEWESLVARHAGTVIHGLLEEICHQGPEVWQARRKGDLLGRVKRRLAGLGTPEGELARVAEKVLRSLEAALSGKRGKWILRKRQESACEFKVSGFVDGCLMHAVVDRTFVDEDGSRWIIDYKSSEPGDENLEGFLLRELERYRAQMTAYARLFRQMEKGRVLRAGLYFPLVDGWCEVPLDEI
jgi:ATP-dependent helicase/nuclease subunit A